MLDRRRYIRGPEATVVEPAERLGRGLCPAGTVSSAIDGQPPPSQQLSIF